MPSLQKVQPGSPLRIPADTYNTFIDVAQAFRDRQLSQAGGSQFASSQSGIVLVHNISDEDQDRFAVMCIAGVVIEPADNEPQFTNRPAFEVDEPATATLGKFVILVEPIAAGRFGKAMIAGVSPVKLDVQSESDGYADAADSVTGSLKTASSGPVRILWKETGTGVKWGVVQFPIGGGGSGNVVSAFRVKSVGYEYLTCREVNPATGVEGTVDVSVLMPQDLRYSTWHGKTINGVAYVGSGGSSGRTATAGSITENQLITPPYVPASGDWPGSMIWAAAIPTVNYCNFLDLNVDGRAWAWDGL